MKKNPLIIMSWPFHYLYGPPKEKEKPVIIKKDFIEYLHNYAPTYSGLAAHNKISLHQVCSSGSARAFRLFCTHAGNSTWFFLLFLFSFFFTPPEHFKNICWNAWCKTKEIFISHAAIDLIYKTCIVNCTRAFILFIP